MERVLPVVAEKVGEMAGKIGGDAVDERVEPGGINVASNEVVLRVRRGLRSDFEQTELLEDVEDGVGLEEEREGDLPDLQTGAAQLRGEFGGAGAGFGGVEAAAYFAVEEVGD